MSEMTHVRGSLCAFEEITPEHRIDALLVHIDPIVTAYKKAIALEANKKADFCLVLTMDLPREGKINPAELSQKEPLLGEKK